VPCNAFKGDLDVATEGECATERIQDALQLVRIQFGRRTAAKIHDRIFPRRCRRVAAIKFDFANERAGEALAHFGSGTLDLVERTEIANEGAERNVKIDLMERSSELFSFGAPIQELPIRRGWPSRRFRC
jgi:hypothetical protein